MTDFEQIDRDLLPGFTRRFVDAGAGPILTLSAGEGPPLLLLHGDPQTHLCWHQVAPALTRDFTVVLTDLRGRGESHKPAAADNGYAYSKRAMGQEQVDVMAALGHSSFHLAGHDRGARVARRMALDHPERVRSLAVMDIVPALDFYERADAGIAQDYFYFFFLTQPHPQPEKLIGGDAEGFMDTILTGLGTDRSLYDPAAFAAYLSAASTPEAITAMCECFRAGLAHDREHDRVDREAGRQITCPTRVFWGSRGVAGQRFDMVDIWKAWAPEARMQALDCGHFIPEEAPAAIIEALQAA